MLSGPNEALLRSVCARTDAPVVASGGVGSLRGVRTLVALTDVGVEGAIIGTALYLQAFELADALAVAGSQVVP